MFRMEFQSLDAVEEDEGRSEPYRNEGRARRSSEYDQPYRTYSPPRIHEGRVGRFSRMQRVESSNGSVHTVSHLPSVTITRTRSLNSEHSIPKNWVEVDLIDFSEPPKAPAATLEAPATAGEQEVMREFVKPFAQSVNVRQRQHPPIVAVTAIPKHQPVRDFLSDGVDEVQAQAGSGPSPNTASLEVRTHSTHSRSSCPSDSSDAESSPGGSRIHAKDDSERASPHATRAVNKALNKLRHKKNKPAVPEAKFVKPWEEPLLLTHEQVKLERKAQKEAKLEARRQAEEDRREAEVQQRELLELANPVPESSLKHQKEHVVRKGIHKLFHIHGGIHSNQASPRVADAREAKLVTPRAGLFEGPLMSPSTTDIALSQIRSSPRPVAKSDLTFVTVESHQRDVQPWTMEEYMAKNARIAEWEKREDDEEFGGIEGNQLLNQYFDNDALDNVDDSDSD